MAVVAVAAAEMAAAERGTMQGSTGLSAEAAIGCSWEQTTLSLRDEDGGGAGGGPQQSWSSKTTQVDHCIVDSKSTQRKTAQRKSEVAAPNLVPWGSSWATTALEMIALELWCLVSAWQQLLAHPAVARSEEM